MPYTVQAAMTTNRMKSFLSICFVALFIAGCGKYEDSQKASVACFKYTTKQIQKYVNLYKQGKIEDGQLGGFTCIQDKEDGHYKAYTTKKGGDLVSVVKRFYYYGNP